MMTIDMIAFVFQCVITFIFLLYFGTSKKYEQNSYPIIVTFIVSIIGMTITQLSGFLLGFSIQLIIIFLLAIEKELYISILYFLLYPLHNIITSNKLQYSLKLGKNITEEFDLQKQIEKQREIQDFNKDVSDNYIDKLFILSITNMILIIIYLLT